MINTIAFNGLSPKLVETQLQIINGQPGISLVGLADRGVSEAKERIQAAFFKLGLALPYKRLVINLSPADLPKIGNHFDLPIACAILQATGILPEVSKTLVLGELGLDSSINSVEGVLAAAIFCLEHDITSLICPYANGSEAAWVGEKLTILPARNLWEIIEHFKGNLCINPPVKNQHQQNQHIYPDFKNIRGQHVARRALEIAASGRHNVLMIGAPGGGKSLLASSFPSILPPLTSKQSLELSMIHSIAGVLKEGQLVLQPPFRSPHHSASTAALVGGGIKLKPGEISLAHHGVLFLDELPEFQRATLDSLRQPLEEGQITIARANGCVQYPANFQLIAAMNPCKCGYLGMKERECRKAPNCGKDYFMRLSGPIFDRIDMVIYVDEIEASELVFMQAAEASHAILARTKLAYMRQINRQNYTNNLLTAEDLPIIAALDTKGQQVLLKYMQKFHISARGYSRILKVSRTIADLAACELIQPEHLAEAMSYRFTMFT